MVSSSLTDLYIVFFLEKGRTDVQNKENNLQAAILSDVQEPTWIYPDSHAIPITLKSPLPTLGLALTTSREDHFLLLLLCLSTCVHHFPESHLTYDWGIETS